MTVKLELESLFTPVRADLARVEERIRAAAEVDYPLLAAVVSDIIQSGGKRLRPAMMLLIARALHPDDDYDFARVITAAAASELLHTAGLVHDDLIDRADTRRGTPTLNSLFNPGTVILIGDYLFAQAARTAADTGSARVMAIFGQILAEVTDGQLREIFKAHDPDQTFEEYEGRIYGKTASLFAGSAEIAAVLCDASEAQLAAVRQFASDLGLAFQVVDDVLDIQETSEKLGKPAGSDLRQGTVTLPMLLFLHNGYNAQAAARLRTAIVGQGVAEEDYEGAIAALRSTTVLRDSLDRAIGYAERAKAALRNLPPSEARDLLGALADFAVERHR